MKLKKWALIAAVLSFGFASNSYAKFLIKSDTNL